MTEQKWPRIQCWVKDFGPIREGSFDLAPLTVFIGPNGSGKTYAATLAYLFMKALEVKSPDYFWWDLYTLLTKFTAGGATETIIVPDVLDSSMQDTFRQILSKIVDRIASFQISQLPQYFGRESPEPLLRQGGEKLQFGFKLEDIPLFIQGEWQREGGWHWEWDEFEQIRLTFSLPYSPPRAHLGFRPEDIYYAFLGTLGFPAGVFYLPAARAGLLQGWRVLMGMALRLIRREIGLRRIEATPYTGVAGDFLLTLAEGAPHYRRSLRESGRLKVSETPALRLLEEEILHGYVAWRSREDPELLLFQKEMRVPLTAISSGLAELAPLDLLLRKRILGPGDWLIIEEPEAHLHPENQRRIATLMVRLVRWGVRVLCTTHSDIILHQISNHLLLEKALQKDHRPEGFDPDWDRLGYDEVGVYLFRMEDDGSVIEPVVPEPDFGIPEDEFVRVAEAIGSQTYSLLDLIESE